MAPMSGRARRAAALLAVVLTSTVSVATAAAPAPTPQEDDFSYLQLGVLAERIKTTLYDEALKGHWTVDERQALLDLKFSAMRHDGAITAAMGAEAPVDGDFEYVLPAGVLKTKAGVFALARRLERLTVSVYTAGAEGAQDKATRRLLASLLSQDAQHLSLISVTRGGRPVTELPGPVGPERAGAVIDPFLAVPSAPDVPEDDATEPQATAAAAGLSVYAASSLREAFPALDGSSTYNFAGSNQLQLQIEKGAPADVFASASPQEAQALFGEDRCERPVTFATNVVVLLVPKANPANIDSVYDLDRGKPKRLAVGTKGVPIGDYTRKLLRKLRLTRILERNTVSSEPNVASITSKVALGSADAGFAYVTDGRAVSDRVRMIRLPKYAQPPVRYQICAVRRDGADTGGAHAFIDRAVGSEGRKVLKQYGFGLPPRS